MTKKMINVSMETLFVAILLLFVPVVIGNDDDPIPADKSQVNAWFHRNVQPLSLRKGTLNPAIVAAEAHPKIIKVKADGSGDFKKITDAVKSIPSGNTVRTIVYIGGGNYSEKVKVEITQPFVTFYGDARNPPIIVHNGNAKRFGTMDSGTVIVEGDHFSAVNIIFVNNSPRPGAGLEGGQATAMRISGDMSSFYNCKFYGYQDTLCDDHGNHFFKDCYVTGTVDFIFGNGKSLYVNTELHVIPGDLEAFVTAHARASPSFDSAYSFVQCSVTGTGNFSYLGRAWKPYSKVIFSLCDISDVIRPAGWSDHQYRQSDRTVFYAEYNNRGAGADLGKRAAFSKKLTGEAAKSFITLKHIGGSKWLLPPTKV